MTERSADGGVNSKIGNAEGVARSVRLESEPQHRVILCFALLMVGLYLCSSDILRFSTWQLDAENPAWLEAMAWHSGRFEIADDAMRPESPRPHDTAWKDGKVYNIFPPLFTAICYVSQSATRWQAEWGGLSAADAGEFYGPWYVGLIALPIPFTAFWAFRRSTGRSEWAAVMTAYLVLGTPLLSLLFSCRSGGISQVNQVLGCSGMLLIAGDVLGQRRIWPGAIGLVVGLWTRQLTVIYAAALVWAAWGSVDRRRLKLGIAGAALVIGFTGVMALNTAKFGNPFDVGYGRIYAGRTDHYAEQYRETGHLFDARYFPRNFAVMNFSLPDFRISRMRVLVGGASDGASIWLTTPVLIYVFVFTRRWWRDPARRALVLCSIAVMLLTLMYHLTGSVQRGMYRYAMDYAPIWLVVIAPWLAERRHRGVLLACLAWSALYFHLLCASELPA